MSLLMFYQSYVICFCLGILNFKHCISSPLNTLLLKELSYSLISNTQFMLKFSSCLKNAFLQLSFFEFGSKQGPLIALIYVLKSFYIYDGSLPSTLPTPHLHHFCLLKKPGHLSFIISHILHLPSVRLCPLTHSAIYHIPLPPHIFCKLVVTSRRFGRQGKYTL